MKRIFKWPSHEDYSKQDNNYCCESDHIDVESDYDSGDYLDSCISSSGQLLLLLNLLSGSGE